MKTFDDCAALKYEAQKELEHLKASLDRVRARSLTCLGLSAIGDVDARKFEADFKSLPAVEIRIAELERLILALDYASAYVRQRSRNVGQTHLSERAARLKLRQQGIVQLRATGTQAQIQHEEAWLHNEEKFFEGLRMQAVGVAGPSPDAHILQHLG